MYVRTAAIRKLANRNGRRVGKQFLLALEISIQKTIECACRQHNGGKKTLDDSIFSFSKHGLK